jgi:hypothetical protein
LTTEADDGTGAKGVGVITACGPEADCEGREAVDNVAAVVVAVVVEEPVADLRAGAVKELHIEERADFTDSVVIPAIA